MPKRGFFLIDCSGGTALPALAFRTAASYRSKVGPGWNFPFRQSFQSPATGEQSMTKWVYTFGDGAAEGRAGDRNLLGGKGANLAEMCSLGLPVPPGFTITTEACTSYYGNELAFPPELEAEVTAGLEHTARITGRRLGDPDKLLL